MGLRRTSSQKRFWFQQTSSFAELCSDTVLAEAQHFAVEYKTQQTKETTKLEWPGNTYYHLKQFLLRRFKDVMTSFRHTGPGNINLLKAGEMTFYSQEMYKHSGEVGKAVE